MEWSDELRDEFKALVERLHRVASDVAAEVEEVLALGRERPLLRAEAVATLRQVVSIVRAAAEQRGDAETLRSLAGDVEALIQRIVSTRERPAALPVRPADVPVTLLSKDGVEPKPVVPRPVYHGREVPMRCGFVKTTDIRLWEGNERLDIHLGQFRQKHGRSPSSEELLDIMLSRLPLPGVADSDQFHIKDLARSIAINGVQKPPIIDVNGTLLDGNRRVAACYYILNSDEFEVEQKKRAEYLFVWQLTEFADADDRRAVVVALNFEPDYKEEWPDYVRARKVYESWEALLALEPRRPGQRRQAELKRQLARDYAISVERVSRYLKMIEWANPFEDYHIIERSKDHFEVKHKATEYFQYFDELSKGEAAGVAYCLTQDDAFRHLVFDLLYDGKFKRFSQIRKLRYISDNEEARAALRKAREEPDREEAQDIVDSAITIADMKRAEVRLLGANTRIETFTKWLEELPAKAFRDEISPQNLRRLLRALELVRPYAVERLGPGAVETADD